MRAILEVMARSIWEMFPKEKEKTGRRQEFLGHDSTQPNFPNI